MCGVLKGRLRLAMPSAADAEQLAGGNAGADVVEDIHIDLAHLVVDVDVFVVQLAEHYRAGEVGEVVALTHAAEVHAHLIAAAHDVVGGQGVDQGGLLAGAHDEEIDVHEAVVQHVGLDYVGELDLGAAGVDRLDALLHGAAGDVGGVGQVLDLAGLLDHADQLAGPLAVDEVQVGGEAMSSM